jgi:2-polyprenyl-3-methyl-5-hydroxy-6-metoxy-1,4-benzoquinol methylase
MQDNEPFFHRSQGNMNIPGPNLHCWSCGSVNVGEPKITSTGQTIGEGICKVYECNECGHGTTYPIIADLAKLYESRETQDYQANDAKFVTLIKKWVFHRQANKLLRQSSFRSGRIIDFGCGSGVFTEALAGSNHVECEVIAMDFFVEPPEFLSRATYLPFCELEKSKNSANLVTCMHVLEHDNDPVALLHTIKGLMKENARLVVEVPNVQCRWRRVFGKSWANWYLPFHRHHFSRRSLATTLERAGFSIDAMHDVHAPAIGRSLANALNQRNSMVFVFLSGLFAPIQGLAELVSGEPSALRVIASRSS